MWNETQFNRFIYHFQRTIQRKKHAFEAKSAEIEVYLNEKACKEKEWLEEDDTNENVASSHEEIDGSSSLQRSMSNNDATESSSLGKLYQSTLCGLHSCNRDHRFLTFPL